VLRVLKEAGHFFEGPRWHDGKWWVSDFYAHTVYSITPDGEATVELEVPTQPSGLGWLPDGSLLVVSMLDHKLLRRWPDGRVTEHADISEYCGGHANDMVVTADGRAYVGNFGFDLMAWRDPGPTNVVRVDPDGTVALAAADVWFPNGSVILSDGVTLVIGETLGARYSAWTIQPDGTLTDRRVWAELGSPIEVDGDGRVGAFPTVSPDGCAVDRHDRIWMADAVGGRVALVAAGEGGMCEIVDEIIAPDGLGFFACALGGPAGDTLLICAAPDYFQHNREHKTEAVLYTVDL
jgi:sugar lactone lactonase YvrE